MDELLDERNLSVGGTISFANEAVLLDGETADFATIHHESFLAQKLHAIVEKIGGRVTGDEALYI